MKRKMHTESLGVRGPAKKHAEKKAVNYKVTTMKEGKCPSGKSGPGNMKGD